MRGKVESAAVVTNTNTTNTTTTGHLSQVARGAEPSNRGSGCLDWLTGQTALI